MELRNVVGVREYGGTGYAFGWCSRERCGLVAFSGQGKTSTVEADVIFRKIFLSCALTEVRNFFNTHGS